MSRSPNVTISILLLGAAACGGVRDGDLGRFEEAISAGRYTVKSISTISYAPNSFVIGNVYPGWTDDLTGVSAFRSGPGNPNGATYVWGHIFGNNFDACAWIDETNVTKTNKSPTGTCGAPQINYDTPLFRSTYTNGTINPAVADGCATHMHYAGSGCVDHNGYGNVEPWRVPATPANSTGIVPDGRLLRWRYVTKDNHWVLIRDPTPGVNPNWYFVERGCVSLNPWCGGAGEPCCNPNNVCDNGNPTCSNGLVCSGGACCAPSCAGKCGGASDGCGGHCNSPCPAPPDLVSSVVDAAVTPTPDAATATADVAVIADAAPIADDAAGLTDDAATADAPATDDSRATEDAAPTDDALSVASDALAALPIDGSADARPGSAPPAGCACALAGPPAKTHSGYAFALLLLTLGLRRRARHRRDGR